MFPKRMISRVVFDARVTRVVYDDTKSVVARILRETWSDCGRG